MNSTEDLTEVLEKHPFTFAVVRHPWQRLVSAYLDFKTRSRNPENKAGKLARGSFSGFLRDSVLKNNYSCTNGGCASVSEDDFIDLTDMTQVCEDT